MLLEQGMGNEHSNGKLKRGTKLNLNPSPISNFISNTLFCSSEFSFLISPSPVLVSDSQFPVLVAFVHVAGR